MSRLSLDLKDVAATEDLARQIAPHIKRGDALLLSGDLGAGKSVFARAILRARGVKGDVPSPTFTLVQFYDLAPFSIFHFDLYRLKKPEEIEEIGFDEALADGAALVEWPSMAASYMPRDALALHFEIKEGPLRRVTIDMPPAWEERRVL